MSKRLGVILIAMLCIGACFGGPEPTGDPVAGQQIAENVDNSCGLCHTLEGAGYSGTVGPDLDVLAPGYQRVLDAIRTGPGAMPSYRGELSSGELRDLAAYISGEAAP